MFHFGNDKEILETLGTFTDIEAQWAVNEKVAYEAAFGACIAGSAP